MENMIYYVFIFIVIPMAFALIFLDKKSRPVIACMIMGIVMCLLASEINAAVLSACGNDFFYLSTTISPIIEEILKAIPLAFAAFLFLDECSFNKLLSCGFAIGLGFAIFENIVTCLQNFGSVSFAWAIARGFGSGMVHGICTGIIGIGFYIYKKKKNKAAFLTLGLLCGVIIYHGIYNCLVQTDKLVLLGLLLPICTYALLFLFRKKFSVIREMLVKQDFLDENPQ